LEEKEEEEVTVEVEWSDRHHLHETLAPTSRPVQSSKCTWLTGEEEEEEVGRNVDLEFYTTRVLITCVTRGCVRRKKRVRA
tara:strand:- start:202 stop:444 length:243 start_codon:yes stop_codon:yes gene_type:complete